MHKDKMTGNLRAQAWNEDKIYLPVKSCHYIFMRQVIEIFPKEQGNIRGADSFAD
jgi:hypothetical protein